MIQLINKYGLILSVTGILVFTILESYTPFDQLFQNWFYVDANWLISKQLHKSIKLLYYTGPKIALGIIAGLALIASVVIHFNSRLFLKYAHWRQSLLLITLSIALVPLFQASLKAITGIYSPVDLAPYGGKYTHIGLLEQLWKYGSVRGGRSFPAGHASGGFALMALYFLPLKPSLRLTGLCFGLAAGTAMGLYQIARGEHFLSHTLVTMFAAWLIIWSLSRLLRIKEKEATA